MKTSKLFLTSLLAAAAMSAVPAYAGFVWNGGENINQELWQTEDSWVLTGSTTWPTDARATGPLTPYSNAWNGVTVANASGTVDTFEGWALGLTLQNANLTVTTLKKLQGGCTLNLDAGSVLTVNNFSGGNDGGSTTLNVEGIFNLAYNKNQGGEGFIANLGNSGVLNFTAYDATRRTAKVSQLNATLNTADFDSYTIAANGNTVYTRNLITLGDNVRFDDTETAVTMTAGVGVGTLNRVNDISNATAGSYKVTKNDSGYSVSYVVAGTTYAWNATAAGSVWDTSALNWTTGGSPNVAFTSGGNVLFGSGVTLSKTVAIDSAVAAGTISVADDYTFNVGASGSLSATAVAVAGTKTATLNLASAMTLSANLGGAGTLKKTGTAALTYTGTISSGATLEIAEGGTNSFSGTLSGNLTIGNATVNVERIDSLDYEATNTNTVTVNQGGVLDFGVKRWTVGSNNKIVLGGGTIQGTGDGTGALDFYRSATVEASTGTTSEISATVKIRNEEAGTKATFTVGFDAILTVSGTIKGDGALQKNGTGKLVVSGTNDYAGGTTISAGTLVAASASALGAGAVTVNGTGSILDVNLSGTLEQAENQALTTTNGGKITVSAGTLALTGAVNLSSEIEVASGASVTTTNDVSFALAGLTGTSNGNGSTTFTLFTLADGAFLEWNGLTAANINLSGTTIAGRGATATFNNAAGTVTVVSGTAGDLVWNGTSGSSTWNYTAANTNWKIGEDDTSFQYIDNVTFDGTAENKTVSIGGNLTVGTITVSADGYTFSATDNATITSGAITISAPNGITLEAAQDKTLTFSSSLKNNSSGDPKIAKITKTGEGVVNIANDTRVGALDVQGGTLEFGTTASGMISNFKIASGATLTVVAGNDFATWGNTTYDIAGTLNMGTCRFSISGGTFKLNGGTISGGGDDNGNYASALDFYGDTTVTASGTSTISAKTNIRAGKTATFDVADGATLNISGVLRKGDNGTATLKKTGAGELTLSGDTGENSGQLALQLTEGITTISAGTKSVKEVSVTGGVLNISGGTTTTTSGTTVGNGAVLVLGASGDASHLQGVLTINNGGKVELTGGDATGYGNAEGTDATNVIYKLVINKGGVLEIGTDATQNNQNQTFNMKDGIVLLGGQITAKNGVSNAKFDLFNKNTTTAGVTTLGSDTTAVISADIGLRNKGSFNVASGTTADGVDLLVSGRLTNYSAVTGGNLFPAALTKSGAGTMKLTGDNRYWTKGGTIEQGTLIAAHANALGKGGTIRVLENATLGFVAETTVDMLKTTTTNDGTTTTNGAIQLTSGAKIVVDMLGQDANQEKIVLDLVSGVALSYGGVDVTADNVGTLLDPVISLTNWGDGWTQSLSYADSTLRLTLTIPEPSVFGLLAGLGALALAGTRRRRRKA